MDARVLGEHLEGRAFVHGGGFEQADVWGEDQVVAVVGREELQHLLAPLGPGAELGVEVGVVQHHRARALEARQGPGRQLVDQIELGVADHGAGLFGDPALAQHPVALLAAGGHDQVEQLQARLERALAVAGAVLGVDQQRMADADATEQGGGPLGCDHRVVTRQAQRVGDQHRRLGRSAAATQAAQPGRRQQDQRDRRAAQLGDQAGDIVDQLRRGRGDLDLDGRPASSHGDGHRQAVPDLMVLRDIEEADAFGGGHVSAAAPAGCGRGRSARRGRPCR